MKDTFVELESQNILVLRGEVTAANVMDIRKAGESIIGRMPSSGVVELSELGSANAVTLSLILAWLRAAKQKNRSVVIRGMPKKLFDMARVSGLELILPFE